VRVKKRDVTSRGLCHVGCARMAGHHRNKDVFCLGGRSHGGYFVLAPGSPPMCAGVLPCLHVSSDPSTSHNVLPSLN